MASWHVLGALTVERVGPWSVMSVWWAIIAVVGSGLIALVGKWMTLRFLQRIRTRKAVDPDSR